MIPHLIYLYKYILFLIACLWKHILFMQSWWRQYFIGNNICLDCLSRWVLWEKSISSEMVLGKMHVKPKKNCPEWTPDSLTIQIIPFLNRHIWLCVIGSFYKRYNDEITNSPHQFQIQIWFWVFFSWNTMPVKLIWSVSVIIFIKIIFKTE